MPLGSQGLFVICELVPVGWGILNVPFSCHVSLWMVLLLSMGSRACSFNWFFQADLLHLTTKGVELARPVSGLNLQGEDILPAQQPRFPTHTRHLHETVCLVSDPLQFICVT